MGDTESDLAASENEILRLRAEVSQIEERFLSFLDSELESIFCYEPDAPVPMSLPAVKVAELFTDSRLVVANPTFARLRNEPDVKNLIGGRMKDLARESLPRIVGLITQLIENGNARKGAEVRQTLPDGSIRYAMSNAHLVSAGGAYTRLWVILRDITEQKRLQAEHDALQIQFRQSQRMESLGLLAGGIAHDFNNLLVVIENCSQFAREDMERNPNEARTSLRHIEDASARAAALVRSLMAFARPRSGAMKAVFIDAFVVDLTALLRRLIPSRIAVHTFLDAGQAVQADVAQLEQVLVNLVINAVDAIDDIGEITVRTTKAVPTALQRSSYPWLRGDSFVRLSVTDSGRGILPEVRARLFEPFFTTKAEGKGNGLGLSVVWGAVKSHGGFVDVQSATAQGHGTEFCVYLPSFEDRTATPAPSVARTDWGGQETVLLADDHELVRDVTKALLERSGYRVLAASDGQEAISVFAANADAIDVVILDAIMPNVSGFVAYQRIREIKPKVAILVASGHTSDLFPADWLATTKPRMLSKPFRSEELLQALRALLDET